MAADPVTHADSSWADADTAVTRMVRLQSEQSLKAYAAKPLLIEEHANIERSVTQGGYGHRQLYELVQNGADQLQDQDAGGGIHVVLTQGALYCANGGEPVSPEGVETILASHLSRKRGTEIGRFGLGFKSVLSISDTPQFFSRSGSFGWDKEASRRRIRETVDWEGPIPVLRIAHLLDVKSARAHDPVLDELTRWASTVIRLPLTGRHAERLARDIREFPAKFAIFSPHVGEVILEDRRDHHHTLRREIYVKGEGNKRTLFTDDGARTETSEWLVFETIHEPSPKARAAAGEYHDRTRIPLCWAVPTTGSQGLGQFWAFFPTNYETTLRGVINAPWKTNEDRQNLLQNNAFNDELMRAAAKLVVSALPRLSTSDDPARHLTLITARGREPRNWADDMLTDLVYRSAAQSASLPDQTGKLTYPTGLHLHPEKLDKRWLERWAGYSGRPVDWCHHSVEETVRRSRAEIILERAGKRPSSVVSWLEALVSDRTSAASAVALSIVADMVHQNHPHAELARSAKVLRTDQGELVAPVPDTVFTRTDLDAPGAELRFVDPDLQRDPAAAWALGVLGIREADVLGRFAAHVRRGVSHFTSDDWERFWVLARPLGPDRAIEQLGASRIDVDTIRVRVRAGEFRPLRGVLLPGRVVPEGGRADQQFVVDTSCHAADMGMLRALGMSDVPRLGVDPSGEEWFVRYRERAVEIYRRQMSSGGWLPAEKNIVVDGPAPAGPLELLKDLSPEANVRFVRAIPPAGMVLQWTVHAGTSSGKVYKDVKFTISSPLVVALKRFGLFSTSKGPRRAHECVGPGLRMYEHVLPVATEIDPALVAALKIADTLDDIGEQLWDRLLADAEGSDELGLIGALYALASTQLEPPDAIRCRLRDGWDLRLPSEAAVTSEQRVAQTLIEHDVPTVLVPDADSEHRLVEAWGLQRASDALVTELRAVPLGEAVPLVDTFPALGLLPGQRAQGVSLVRCSEVEELVRTNAGLDARPVEIGRQDDIVYWREREDDFALLVELNGLLGLGLTPERCRAVLKQREEQRRSERVVRVRKEKAPADKLRAMLPVETIREKVPRTVLSAVEARNGTLDDRTVAELAIDVYGTRVLSEYRQELEQQGITVPTQMAGSHEAKRFTQDLGFPVEFAGFRRPSLAPTLTVEGPVRFPPLHAYQERMVQRVSEVLQGADTSRMRGMLSLPTGAGKTRVVVEALTRTLNTQRFGTESRPILWIAQSGELCEQAVQTWQFVWRHIGPAKRLTISRLWEGNEADPVSEGAHLVVATDAKLDKVIDKSDYAWLRESQAVVVDEAHTSISPRYTRIFEALGLTARRTRCPLVGLSATPFRGVSTEETERLTARYGKHRFDHDRDGTEILGEDPYRALQDLGVLAQVKHKVLEGSTIHLSEEERTNLEQMRRLPASAEERLGSDDRRNTTLLDEVLTLPDDWQILLFATSVSHAQALAALLKREGVAAAAVAGSTDEGERRYIVDQFGQRKIRVLTNYGVLAQGFDAPRTRAVIVARPTYSPNVYQQMIGRGLRGPLNGGEEECLIVNVADNVAQYGEELAFRQFEGLWRSVG